MSKKFLAAVFLALFFSSAAVSSAESPSPAETVNALSLGEVADVIGRIKTNSLNRPVLDETELNRATLQGLLERLAPGVSISAGRPADQQPSPFRAEVLDGRIGYLRLGSLAKGNVAEMDAALLNFNAKLLKSLVLDLRATPESGAFDLAAEVANRFCAKGKLLFSVKKNGTKPERIFTSNQDASFSGLLVVIVDGGTAGAPEVVAAALRLHANAMVVGGTTMGEGVEFSDETLPGGKTLRIAVAEVVLPDGSAVFPKGVKPDIAIGMSPDVQQEVLKQGLKKGVAPFVFETERVQMNEAALVAGTNPEVDVMQTAQHLKNSDRAKPPLRDVVLQRAVDVITSIGLFQGKPQVPEK